jgi:hypothetical protein
MYVCIYICMYVCTYVCMCVHRRMHAWRVQVLLERLQALLHLVHTHVGRCWLVLNLECYMYVCIYVCIYAHMYVPRESASLVSPSSHRRWKMLISAELWMLYVCMYICMYVESLQALLHLFHADISRF